MAVLRVARMQARYRLPRSQSASRERLDRILRETVEETLSLALARGGVPERGEICIRRLHVPAHLHLGTGDSSVAAAWSIALATAIQQRIERGGHEVVRYESRAEALVDLLEGVATGDLRRAWAWRQLGFWDFDDPVSPEAAARALHALASEPRLVVPVLRTVARSGHLVTLVRLAGAESWLDLARAALTAASADPALARSGVPPDTAETSPSLWDTVAARIRGRSILLHALPAGEDPPAQLRTALALLAVLEVEPAAVVRGGAEVEALVAAVRGVLASLVSREAIDAGASDGREDSPSMPIEQILPQTALLGSRANGVEPEPEVYRSADLPTSPAASDGQRPLPEVRHRARTGYGGLLFLLHLIEELGIVAEVVASELFARRSLRWVLHQLTLRLVPITPADAAALAVAGLGPHEDPPSAAEEPPTTGEEEVLEALAQRLAERVRERLGREEDAAWVVAEVCRRDAEIIADPGWIEVHFSLEQVSTELRRAGLDRDPGYVRWLGVVVRFVYG